jgi:Kef-type K+ transport system membrane component KefB
MHHLLNEIAIAIVGATLMGLVCHFLRQPIILGYVLAGVIVGGNFGFGLVEDPHTVEIISEIGLILLLFIIGLEINLRQLLSSGRQLLLTATAQYPLCVGLAFLFFSIFTIPYISNSLELLYLCLLCGLSSTAIVVKGLYDKGELDTLPGRMTIGTLVFQDMYAILILAVQPNLANPSMGPIITAIGCTILLLAAGFLFSKFLLRPLFKSISKSPEMIVCVSLAWCALMAGAADTLGVSMEMGALVAGLAISAFPYSMHVTAKTLPLRDFFLTLFFVSLGMKLTIPGGPIVLPIVVLSAFILLSRFSSIYPMLTLTSAGRRAAFVTSLNLSQMSEFALVIASIGLGLGHLNEDLVSLLVLSMVILSLISSYAIRYSHELFLFFDKALNKFMEEKNIFKHETDSGETCEIVFVGFHRGAQALLEVFQTHFPQLVHKMLVIDFNPVTLSELEGKGIRVLFGDLASYDTLEHAHIGHARIIISTIPDQLLKGTNNRALVKMLRGLSPDACIIATADDATHQFQLKTEGADLAIIPYELTATWLAPLIQKTISEEMDNGDSIRNADVRTFVNAG